MHIGVAGFGAVGRAIARFFSRSADNSVRIYDKFVDPYTGREHLRSLNDCELVFLAVPTPFDAAAGRCDISAVKELVDNIGAPVCIKSTVPPGTTADLTRETGRPLAFSPEYVGESASHPWPEIDDCGFVVIGGDPATAALVRKAYKSAGPSKALQFIETDSTTAELAKYMDNAFLATKVAFVNQFFDLARRANVDFEELRRLFILDPRVGATHTSVTPQRGFEGKCLPKDLASILAWAGSTEGAPLLAAIKAYNDALRDHQPM